YRAIRKSRANFGVRPLGDRALDCALRRLLADRAALLVYQRDRGAASRRPPPGLDALHPADNFVDQRLIRIIAARTEPSMRPDAGFSAKRVDLESAVVGQRRNSRALEVETRFDQCVLGESRSRLLGSLGNSELGEGYQFELDTDAAQDQSVLFKFRRIRSRNQ